MSGLFDHLKGHSPAHEAEALAHKVEEVVHEVEAAVEPKAEPAVEAPAK